MLTVLLNILFLTCAVQSENLIHELVRKDISNERRDVVVEQLKQSDISEAAPMILKLINDFASHTEPGIGDKPWMSDHHSHRAKVWYASHAIWNEWFKGGEDPVRLTVGENLELVYSRDSRPGRVLPGRQAGLLYHCV